MVNVFLISIRCVNDTKFEIVAFLFQILTKIFSNDLQSSFSLVTLVGVSILITTDLHYIHEQQPQKIEMVFCSCSSMAVAKHKQFLRELEDQRPDSVLRQRRKQLALYTNNELHVPADFQSPNQSNPYMKVAVWTLTASVGTVALYVLSTAKRWI